jgi:arylsulfatase A-like enzyme
MIFKYKKFFGVFLFVYIVLLNYISPTCASQATPPKNMQKYNVILIAINVLRADHLGSYGYHRKTSPTIDRLAEESFVFKNAFAQAGYTLPNMMSIITSLYPESHRVLDAFKDELSSRVYTMADIFKIYGYKTAWFSMLHVGHLDINAGFGRGYDYKRELDEKLKGKELIFSWIEKNRDDPFFIALNTRSMHTPYFPLARYKDYFNKGEKGDIIDNKREFSKAFYYKIIELINTPGSPMFNIFDRDALTYIFNNHKNIKPETVYDKEYWENKIEEIADLIPQQFLHRLGYTHILTYNSTVNINNKNSLEYLISLYDACLLGVDQELIKPILTKLKNLKIYERTILVITADHGELFGEHKILGHGIKARFYEEVIHVPLIIKLPNFSDRKDIPELTQSIDIMPTILDILGMKFPASIQGKSLLYLMKNDKSGLVNEYVHGQDRFFAYLRSPKWKLIVDRRELKKEVSIQDKLFDIKDDPQELVNLRDLKPGVYKYLREKIKEQLGSLPIYLDKEYTFKPYIDKKTQEKIKETGYW